jgi:nucleosome binding factor SPN SPT16 subunit
VSLNKRGLPYSQNTDISVKALQPLEPEELEDTYQKRFEEYRTTVLAARSSRGVRLAADWDRATVPPSDIDP